MLKKKKEIEKFILKNNIFKGLNLNDVVRKIKDNKEGYLLKEINKYSASPKTLEDVGKVLKLTRERVRQIENKAFKKLRSQRKIIAGYR